MEEKKQKIFFVYLRTGGGHLAPAKSVANYLRGTYKADVKLIDGLENSWWFARFVVVDGYRILQNKAKWIYEVIYFFNKFKPIAHLSAFLVTINTQKYIEEEILKEMPDKIVIFHFLMIKPIYNVIRKHKLDINAMTVVTDPYTAHPLWFLKRDQNFILFSERLKQHCIQQGITEGFIKVFPFIVDEKFSSKIDAEKIPDLKKQFGLSNNKVLLILGGGDGIPKGISILKKLLNHKGGYEIVLVCGNNKRMFKKAYAVKNMHSLDQLKIYGYVDFVFELLNISDVVITKCGASTFMEILMIGKVPIVNTYIWEQEKGNVEFIVENKLGLYENDVKKLPEIVNELFDDDATLKFYSDNIVNKKIISGTAEVGDYLIR